MVKIIGKFLFWFLFILTTNLLFWVVFANYIAGEQEKKIDEAAEHFIKKNINIKANNSSLKFEELIAKLGLSLNVNTTNRPARNLHIYIDEEKRKEFKDIQTELRNYLNIQLGKTNSKINVPPEKLRRYLNTNKKLLKAVQYHVFNNSLPQWEIDYDNITYNDTIPTFLGLVSFQDLLILNILENTRLGQHEEAIKNLEVSWKLQKSITERPDLISQLTSYIVIKKQAVVMRKMPNLSSNWQSRIEKNIKYKLPESFLYALTNESFMINRSARKMSIRDLNELKVEAELCIDSCSKLKLILHEKLIPQTLQLLEPIYRSYLRLDSIYKWYKFKTLITKIPQEYFCSFTAEKFIKKYKIKSEWWSYINIIDSIDAADYAYEWEKLIRVAVHMELTQKIIQAKEFANQLGRWPKKVPGIESSAICKDAKWIYHVSDNGTMSISLNKEFDILNKYSNKQNYIPISYSANFKRDLNVKDDL